MMTPVALPGSAVEDTNAEPAVRLIDARANGLPDEAALRAHARQRSAETGAPFTSRSYSFPFALLAWHTAPVGCDIERIVPCDDAFANSIRTPTERAMAAEEDTSDDTADDDDDGTERDSADRDRRITSLWSSKEALSKALGNALDYDPRRLEGPGAWPDGRSGPWRAATLDLADDRVAWVCWREDDEG
jgi:4'-phosphopantetheinyl transferase superfamily